jgi:hypothetical protein
MSYTIYTLELENNKYYVGKSKLPKQRILKHFSDSNCEWTKRNKPISVLSQLIGDEFDEEKYTLLAMDKHGIENVRGGSYCMVKLSQNDYNKALQTIRSLTDKCYHCGGKGHFSKNCKINIVNNLKSHLKHNLKKDEENQECDKCSGSGITYWSDDIYGYCFRCCCKYCTEQVCDCNICVRCNFYSKHECNCERCICCGNYADLLTNKSCDDCYEPPYWFIDRHKCDSVEYKNFSWCVDCVGRDRCVLYHKGEMCCNSGMIGCDGLRQTCNQCKS